MYFGALLQEQRTKYILFSQLPSGSLPQDIQIKTYVSLISILKEYGEEKFNACNSFEPSQKRYIFLTGKILLKHSKEDSAYSLNIILWVVIKTQMHDMD